MMYPANCSFWFICLADPIVINMQQGPIVIPTKKRTTIYRVNNTLVDGRAPLPRDENPNAIDNNIVQPNGSPVPDIAGAQLADEDVTVAPKFFKFL
jgi:hypothetical protein